MYLSTGAWPGCTRLEGEIPSQHQPAATASQPTPSTYLATRWGAQWEPTHLLLLQQSKPRGERGDRPLSGALSMPRPGSIRSMPPATAPANQMPRARPSSSVGHHTGVQCTVDGAFVCVCARVCVCVSTYIQYILRTGGQCRALQYSTTRTSVSLRSGQKTSIDGMILDIFPTSSRWILVGTDRLVLGSSLNHLCYCM